LSVDPIEVGADVHLVVADLNASKDTVVILGDLQKAFPRASDSIQAGVQKLLGSLNVQVVSHALIALRSGENFPPSCEKIDCPGEMNTCSPAQVI